MIIRMCASDHPSGPLFALLYIPTCLLCGTMSVLINDLGWVRPPSDVTSRWLPPLTSAWQRICILFFFAAIAVGFNQVCKPAAYACTASMHLQVYMASCSLTFTACSSAASPAVLLIEADAAAEPGARFCCMRHPPSWEATDSNVFPGSALYVA